jgi:hypothetical protein
LRFNDRGTVRCAVWGAGVLGRYRGAGAFKKLGSSGCGGILASKGIRGAGIRALKNLGHKEFENVSEGKASIWGTRELGVLAIVRYFGVLIVEPEVPSESGEL